MSDSLTPALDGVRHDFADAGGIRIHYAEAGATNTGAPILLLHGFPELWYAWHKQLTALGVERRVIAPDLPGCGLSDSLRDLSLYRVESIVETIRSLCDALDMPRLVLVGHDWGGAIAWAFAGRYPARVERLVIINAPHPVTFARELRRSLRQRLASAYILLFRSRVAEWVLRAGDYALLDRFARHGLRAGWLTPADAAVYRAAWRRPGALTGGLNYYRAVDLRRGPPADAIDLPTLVIWGMRDRYLRAGLLRGLERYVSSLRVARIDDASHWIIHERPDLVTRLIREALPHDAR